ncbi:MAG: SRPBCC family protein [Desulfatibacillaceae bacterium]
MIIETSIRIRAPVETVWEVFSDLAGWDAWNEVCRECRIEDGGELAAGTCFSFDLRPFAFPIRIAPRVTENRPMERVVWEGSRLGVHAVHTFDFSRDGDATVIHSREELSGPLLLPARLVGATRRLHRLSDRLLEGIRDESERRAQGSGSKARAPG